MGNSSLPVSRFAQKDGTASVDTQNHVPVVNIEGLVIFLVFPDIDSVSALLIQLFMNDHIFDSIPGQLIFLVAKVRPI